MTERRGSRVATLVAFGLAASVFASASAGAQEPMEFDSPDPERFPPNTLVAGYLIDPAVLEEVTNTAELVAALREHLMVEAAMPLQEPLQVNLYAKVSSPRASNAYMFQTRGFTFRLKAEAAVSRDLASVVRASQEAETFSDWDEEEAWTSLLEAIETGLASPTSPVALANGPRERNDEGHVPLRIAAVHNVSWEESEIQESFERDYIEISPRTSFGSSSLAGWEPPEGLTYDSRRLLLELEPVPEAEAAAETELTAVELPPEALDRFVGSYEVQPGTFLDFRREGNVLVAKTRGDGDDELEPRLTAFSETEFWTEVEGARITFTFNLDSDGVAESVTMEQPGFSHEMPRVP